MSTISRVRPRSPPCSSWPPGSPCSWARQSCKLRRSTRRRGPPARARRREPPTPGAIRRSRLASTSACHSLPFWCHLRERRAHLLPVPLSPCLQLRILFNHADRHDRGWPLTAESRLPERIGLTGLARAGDTWSVRIEPFNSNFGGSIYGGAALGAAVEMLESLTGSRVRWATARFLTAPRIGSELILSYAADVVGRRSSHMTAPAPHGDQVAFEVPAVGGNGDAVAGISGQWPDRPAVPPPADCPAIPDRP